MRIITRIANRANAYRKGYRFERRMKGVFEEMGALVFRCAGSKPVDLVVVWPNGKTDLVECKSAVHPWASDYKKVAELSAKLGRDIILVHPVGKSKKHLVYEVIGPEGVKEMWDHGKR